MTTNLDQVSRLVMEHGMDFNYLANSKELNEFVVDMQRIGIDVLQDVDNTQYKAIALLIEGLIISELSGNGKELLAMLLMAESEQFAIIVSIAMKMTIGIAITEEWR